MRRRLLLACGVPLLAALLFGGAVASGQVAAPSLDPTVAVDNPATVSWSHSSVSVISGGENLRGVVGGASYGSSGPCWWGLSSCPGGADTSVQTVHGRFVGDTFSAYGLFTRTSVVDTATLLGAGSGRQVGAAARFGGFASVGVAVVQTESAGVSLAVQSFGLTVRLGDTLYLGGCNCPEGTGLGVAYATEEFHLEFANRDLGSPLSAQTLTLEWFPRTVFVAATLTNYDTGTAETRKGSSYRAGMPFGSGWAVVFGSEFEESTDAGANNDFTVSYSTVGLSYLF